MFQNGKLPVNLIWSRVRLSPYWRTAWLPARKPSPYADEVSDSIWCLKKSPSFLSNCDLVPFFDDVEDDEEAEEVDATLLPEPEIISESSHIWANTWQIPSSTSWLRVRYPVKTRLGSGIKNVYESIRQIVIHRPIMWRIVYTCMTVHSIQMVQEDLPDRCPFFLFKCFKN